MRRGQLGGRARDEAQLAVGETDHQRGDPARAVQRRAVVANEALAVGAARLHRRRLAFPERVFNEEEVEAVGEAADHHPRRVVQRFDSVQLVDVDSICAAPDDFVCREGA